MCRSDLLGSSILLALAVGCSTKDETPEAPVDNAPALGEGFPISAPSVDLGLPAQPGPRDAKRVVEVVWRGLDRAGHACPAGFDYGAGGGLRTFGCRLLSLISYRAVGQIAGVPVFESGPHTTDALDLANPKAFGHYNPAFVQWAVDNLVPAASNISLGRATQPLYDTQVRPLARLFFLVWLERQRDKERFAALAKVYAERLRGPAGVTSSYDSFGSFMVASPFSRFAAENGVAMEELVTNTTAAFWIRRSLDGTDVKLATGLDKLLSVYDGDFSRRAKAFAKSPPPPEDLGGDGGEELADAGPEGELPVPAGAEKTGDPIKDAWLGLAGTRNTCDEFDYFPDGGMRIFACHLFSLVSYEQLVRLAGRSPFLSGPHTAYALDLASPSAFGHYDRAFVRWAVDTLIPGASDTAFRSRTQGLYDVKVRPLARTFMATWREIKKHPDRLAAEVDKYKAALEAGNLEPGWYESYYDYVPSEGETGWAPEGNVAKTCVAFFIRRSLDNTLEELGRGLEKLMKAYDPEF